MSAARDLAQLGNQNAIKVDTTTVRHGINSTTPDSTLDVVGNAEISGVSTFSGNTHVGTGITMYASAGIVSATKFYGDASQLTGVGAGLGTALSDSSTSPLNLIYYTNTTLAIDEDITVEVPSTSSSNTAYTQYQDVVVGDGNDLTIADGDTLSLDILGLNE